MYLYVSHNDVPYFLQNGKFHILSSSFFISLREVPHWYVGGGREQCYTVAAVSYIVSVFCSHTSFIATMEVINFISNYFDTYIKVTSVTL
jgi:hypothetical protein